MRTLGQIVKTLISLRKERFSQFTLLAVYPSSPAVLEAAIMAASHNNAPMLFATTLNQIDRDGGYTGWTQKAFVEALQAYASQYKCSTSLYPCLAHGGPWLKDSHALNNLSLNDTMLALKASLTASLQAGYKLLHIDPVAVCMLPSHSSDRVDVGIAISAELIAYAEAERVCLNLPPVDYEVSTTDVHGRPANLSNVERFVEGLHEELAKQNLLHAWPCFIVANVGTDLSTNCIDKEFAARLYDTVAPYGSLIKGHYTDWVTNPHDYPPAGIGGANVGQELITEEYMALAELEAREQAMCQYRPKMHPSLFLKTLEAAIVSSGRWKKWIQPEEKGCDFIELTPQRRLWLTQTSARYAWNDPAVVIARKNLYENVQRVMKEPHQYVVERIAVAIERYISAFNLFDAMTLLKQKKT